MIFRRCTSILAQSYRGWVGERMGGGVGVGVGVRSEVEKPSWVKTQGHKLPTDGPDHAVVY